MSEAEFTPGPWEKTQNGIRVGGIAIVYHGDGKTWFDISSANCSYETFLEQQPYNADLIVSAPDMYAILNRALDALQRADDYGVPGLRVLMEDTSDVLAKARGE